jgi:hypothetical protein
MEHENLLDNGKRNSISVHHKRGISMYLRGAEQLVVVMKGL